MVTEVFIAVDDNEVYRAMLPPGEYIIGRDETANIKIEHPTISRHHARLVVEEGQVVIADLDSGNGTSIDDVPVSGESSLYEGQTARLGEVRLRARHRVMREALPASSGFYRKGNVVAMGGMGAIHEARQAAMGRKVAMKVMLREESESGLRRFINEARVTGMLEHPNIVPVHELGVDPAGRVFYTMKFVNGTTLAEVLAGLHLGTEEAVKKYPLSFLLTVFQKVCDAIAFAHSRGVHHRDLKPENVMIGDFGEVLVMDWGLSKETGFASDAEDVAQSVTITANGELRTLDGSVLGTPAYMSPEQARGEIGSVDERSDIYSLGVILHEILYLQAPVSGENMNEVVQKVAAGMMDRMPDHPRRHLPGGKVPASLDAVRRKALAYDMDRRYQKVQDLQADIAAYQSGFATSAEAAGLGKHVVLFIKRNKGVSASVLGALVALVGLSAWFTTHLIKARNESLVAEQNAQKELAIRIAADEARAQAEQDRDAERLKAREADNVRMAAEAEVDEIKMTAEELRQSSEEGNRILADVARENAERSRRHLLEGQPKEALDSIDKAVFLAPRNADYTLQLANLLQASGRFGQARDRYRAALEIGADRRTAGSNLELSTELERVQAGEAVLQPQVIERLSKALHAQKRGPEVIMLDAAVAGRLSEPTTLLDEITSLDNSVPPELQPLLRALREYVAQPGWSPERIFLRPDGTAGVNLSGLAIGDLTCLRGHDVAELDLSGTDAESLADLRGLSLKRLNLRDTRVSDLRPLAGKPLEELVCGPEVADLSPLRGLPLRVLDASGTKVSDLSPLEGLPLEELRLDGTPVVNLQSLTGMPLKRLHVNAPQVVDFAPLSTLTELEVLDMPPQAKDIDFAALPKLREVFWRHIRPEAPIGIGELMSIMTLRANLWARHGPVLAQLRLPDLGPHRLIVRDTSGTFDLDLRGTEITNLAALRTMPIQRLWLDTKSVPLKLAPLADIPSLRHLLMVDANVPSIMPVAGIRQLQSIALSRDVADVTLLAAHPSLQRIGYRLDKEGLLPATTVQEFFQSREAVSAHRPVPGAEPLVSFDFDTPADGAQGWTVQDGGSPAPRIYWVSDLAAEGGSGGGHVAFYEREGNGKMAFFAGSPLLSRPQRTSLYGGALVFRLRISEEEPDEQRGRIEVILQSGIRALHHLSPYRARTEWKTVKVPLEWSARWTVGPNGPLATEKDVRDVLDSLDDIMIRAEYTTGLPDERTDLDRVQLWDAASAAALP